MTERVFRFPPLTKRRRKIFRRLWWLQSTSAVAVCSNRTLRLRRSALYAIFYFRGKGASASCESRAKFEPWYLLKRKLEPYHVYIEIAWTSSAIDWYRFWNFRTPYKGVRGFGSRFGLRVTGLVSERYTTIPWILWGRLKRTGTGKGQWPSNCRSTLHVIDLLRQL